MYIWQPNWHLIPWGVLFCLLARMHSSSIFGSRVLFLAAKTGTPFHFFPAKSGMGVPFLAHSIFLHDTKSEKQWNILRLIEVCITFNAQLEI